MTLRVNVENTISIGGNEYRIAEGGNAHRVPTSGFAPKTVIGDVDGTSYPRTSVVRWNDWRGGGGLYEVEENQGITRSTYNYLQGSFKGHLVMTRAFTTTTSDPSNVAGLLGEHNSVIYGAWNTNTDIHALNSSSVWGNKLHDLPAAATDVLSAFRMGGSEYTAWATTGGYTYTLDGAAFTDDATATKYLAFWDDRLWGIDNTGQLWFASTIGTETNDAQLPLADGFVTSLFVGPDATGEPIIYAGTKIGLFAHDAANARFVRTNVRFPEAPNGSQSAHTWEDSIYVPMGRSLLRYIPTQGVIVNVGPDTDDGLPGLYEDANIIFVGSTTRELFVATDGTNDRSSILMWNRQGWEIWDDSSSAEPYTGLHISDAYGNYRLYYGTAAASGFVRHRPLFAGEINPAETNDMTYATGRDINFVSPFGVLDTPWFTADASEISKLAIRLKIETLNPSSTQTIEVLYAIDYAAISLTADTNFTAAGSAITTSGLTTFTFQTASVDSGLTFRAIKFRIKMDTDSSTSTPDMQSLTLEYRKKLPTTWGTTVNLDCRQNMRKRSPETQLAELRTAVESNLMQQVVWRDRDDNEENYFMDITNMEIVEATGNNYEAIVRIQASEN